MTTTLRAGPHKVSTDYDEYGHRTHTVTFVVVSDDKYDGSFTVAQTPGLFLPGSVYDLGNDYDAYAYCLPTKRVTPVITGEPCPVWHVEQKFSTKGAPRCSDTVVEDPLLEPDRVSGRGTSFTREFAYDRNGEIIANSAHQILRGPIVEFDANRGGVRIEQNVADLELDLLAEAQNKVNSVSMWGLSTRKIKLSTYDWSVVYYGQCQVYFVRILDFDIEFVGFDRTTPDEGTRVLNGHWNPDTKEWILDDIDGSAPDPDNPLHFIQATDPNGNPGAIPLNGAGVPANFAGTDQGTITIEHYDEFDFFEFGVPATLPPT